MKEQWFDRCEAPEPSREGDADTDRPTLVQVPDHLLANERAPRTVPGTRMGQSLEELEAELAQYADCEAIGGLCERAEDGDDPWCARPRVDEPSHIGQVIDNRYVVEALIARGGMGIVYRCRHQLIDRKFAVKIIRASMAQLPDAPRRFLIEAKAASTIGNEHIIDVVDYGTLADGSAYLVMELLEGAPLSEIIAKHERLPVGRIRGIAAQVCEGLRAAHEAGIVHRDLKPENIFLSSRKGGDFVKVLDFGIAKMMRAEPLTKRGLIVGTPHYMSPEQAAGAAVDPRGDIYSLGIILYELATGKVPFDATHYMAVLAKHMTEAPPPFDSLCLPEPLPSEFESIVQRCLAKRPDERFQSMTEVMAALERLGRRVEQPSDVFGAPPPPFAEAPREAAFRNSGTSLPAAAGRSVIAQPRQRSVGLVLSALGVLTLAGVSLWRLQASDELHAAGSARAGSELTEPPPEPLPPPPAPATPAPQPAAAQPAADAPASPDALPAADAPASPDGLPAARTVTIVDLMDGKSVEIEARTRLSLRLSEEPHATLPARSSVQRARKPAAAAARSKEKPARPPEHAPSELMNPWPTPAIGPARN